MAVVARKYTRFTTYYAVNTWHGAQVAEKVGRNERDAERRDGAMKREIEAGTYTPPASRTRDTVEGYGSLFFESRTNPYAGDELRMFRLHVMSREWLYRMHLDDWRPSHTDQLLRELRAQKKPDGKRRLTDKTIANIFGAMSLMFDSAVRLEKCLRNPIVLAPNELKRRVQVEKEIYEVGEIAVLVRHHSIPWPVRVLNALCLYTGMREGEACGRRWRDLDDSPAPLAALSIHDQYNGRPLKTERARFAPVHPDLVAILTAWAQEGFELYTGRLPTPDDFIVPAVSKWAKQPNWTRSQYYKAFVKHAAAAGVRPRSLHSTRHSFITHAQRGGADKLKLEKVTHNAAGDMIDRYTHGVWAPLCAAVSCFSLEALPDLHPTRRNPGDSGGKGPSFLRQKSAAVAPNRQLAPGSIPGASTTDEHKTSLALKPRKFRLQYGLGDLREDNRARKRRLLSLAEADPGAAAAPLALARCLDASYQDAAGQADEPALLKQLAKAYHALDLDTPEGRERLANAAGGARG
jgi:integrase